MKNTKITTHELADILVTVARLLRSMPEGPLEEELGRQRFRDERYIKSAVREPSALVALVGFSKFTKRDWAEFIYDMDLPIHVSASHSARDLMGKIVGYFSDHPEGRARLRSLSRKGSRGATSQALLNAFNVLLKDQV